MQKRRTHRFRPADSTPVPAAPAAPAAPAEESAPPVAAGVTVGKRPRRPALGGEKGRVWRVAVLLVVAAVAFRPLSAFCQFVVEEYRKVAVAAGFAPAREEVADARPLPFAEAVGAGDVPAAVGWTATAAGPNVGTTAAGAGTFSGSFRNEAANPYPPVGGGAVAPSFRTVAGGFPATASRAPVVQRRAGPVPAAAGQTLIVDQSVPNSPYAINASDTFATVEVGTTGVGVINQSANTLTVTGTLYLGFPGGSATTTTGNGTYNLSGGTLATTNTQLGNYGTGTFNQTGGMHTVSSTLFIGLNNGTGTYNLGGTGSLSTGTNENVGYTGNGTFNQTGGTNTITGALIVGANNNVTGTYNLGGTGNVSVVQLVAGNGNGSQGTVMQTGGTLTMRGANMYLGNVAGGTGTYNLSGTGSSLSAGIIYDGYDGSGFFIQSGGTATTNGRRLDFGEFADGTGSLTLSGGSLTTGTSIVGLNGGGTVVQSGGTFNTGAGVLNLAEDANSSGSYTLGGTGSLITSSVTVGLNAIGTFTQNGGTVTVGSGGSLQLAQYGGGQGTYQLNGGTLTTPRVFGGNGTSTFYFNGGTLQAGASDNPGAASNPTTFFNGLTHAYVGTGGAIIDTNGYNVTVASVLATDPANGGATDGGLNKQGVGTLTLTANNTYTGTTLVGQGALMVNNVAAKPGDSGTGSGPVYVGQGAWLGGTGTIGGNVTVGANPPTTSGTNGVQPQFAAGAGTLTPGVAVGGVSTPGRLTINGNLTFTGGTSTLEADINGANAGTGYDQVRVGGNLMLAGTLTLTIGAGFKPTLGEKFYLLDLTGTALVSGTFDGLGEGATVKDSAGNSYVINYLDHDPADTSNLLPNDVSLTAMQVVPEPSTWALLGVGAFGVVFALRRRLRACRG